MKVVSEKHILLVCDLLNHRCEGTICLVIAILIINISTSQWSYLIRLFPTVLMIVDLL